jgi:Flp pilus assembly protein TadD
MRQVLRIGIGCGAVALFVLACGGGEPPAKAPEPADTAPPATTASAAPKPEDAPAGKKIEGPAAPTSSDDVKKGIAALKGGDIYTARAAFEAAIQKNPKQADAYHYLGFVYEQGGLKADAEKSYRKAIELDPNLEEPAVNLAALLIENGKNDEAAALMKKAITKNPKSAALQVNLAMALAGKNDIDGAGKALDEAIKLEPNNGIHLVTYAGILAKAGKKDAAVDKLKQAQKISTNDPGVLASVALEYKGMKDFKTCIAVLDKAIGLKDVAELRVYRGTCKLGLKDLSGATTEFKDATTKEPSNALAHYSLGNALADGGKLTEAIAEWEQYLKLAPEGPQAKAAEKKIGIAKAKAGGGAAPGPGPKK